MHKEMKKVWGNDITPICARVEANRVVVSCLEADVEVANKGVKDMKTQLTQGVSSHVADVQRIHEASVCNLGQGVETIVEDSF